MRRRFIIDVGAFVAGLRSLGPAHRVLSLLDAPDLEPIVSLPLLLEYEHAARSARLPVGLTPAEIDDVLDHVCAVATAVRPGPLWRPRMRDPTSDAVLALAIEADCEFVVTHAILAFRGELPQGMRTAHPGRFLQCIRRWP